MNKFIYFSPRLTTKLNAIFQYPLTLVSGAAGIGKSFAVQTFLGSSKAEVIWHASKAPDFRVFLQEFQRNYAVIDDHVDAVIRLKDAQDPIPANMAVEIAVAIKRTGLRGHRAYVLEYQEESVPKDVLEFLYYLSSQHIHRFYVILVTRRVQTIAALEQPCASANVITEDTFLILPREIKQAFARNGIPIVDEEANDLYLRTAGWMPALKQAHGVISRGNRESVFSMTAEELLRFRFADRAVAAAWEDRFAIDSEFWNTPELHEVRRWVEAMEQEKGFIAVERARVKAPRCSPVWDGCDYYSALLLALGGQCKKALDGLNQEFESHIREGQFQSAYRLLLAQLQVRILMGGHWFEDARALLLHYANKRFNENAGITRTAASYALLQAGETRKLAALLAEETPDDAIEAAYRDFLLAAAYRKIGFQEEYEHHLAAAGATVEAGSIYLPMLMFYDETMAHKREERGAGEAEWTPRSPQWHEKLAAWRRAMKRNSAGIGSGMQNQLTVREGEIVECIVRNMSNKEIAAQLHISENTVKTTLKRIYRKLDISSRAELKG